MYAVCYASVFSDINTAVDKLSQLYNINILEKRQELLENWLSTGSLSTAPDVLQGIGHAGSGCRDSHADNIIR